MIIIRKHLEFCGNIELAVDALVAIVDFNATNATTRSFNFKAKITGQTNNDGAKMLK